MCCGGGELCFVQWSLQTAQYLFLTPIYKSFLMTAPKITFTPEFALYECLCNCLLQLPSTTTVIAGTPS